MKENVISSGIGLGTLWRLAALTCEGRECYIKGRGRLYWGKPHPLIYETPCNMIVRRPKGDDVI